MPEAFAIILVFFISAGVIVYARSQANDPTRQNPEQDLARLRGQAESLQRRLHVARKENWGHEMEKSIAVELEATSRRLAEANASSTR